MSSESYSSCRGTLLPSQNHGIRNIRTLEFIEAENTALFSQICRNVGNGIEIGTMLHLHRVQPFMYILHEIMEMDSRLGGYIVR